MQSYLYCVRLGTVSQECRPCGGQEHQGGMLCRYLVFFEGSEKALVGLPFKVEISALRPPFAWVIRRKVVRRIFLKENTGGLCFHAFFAEKIIFDNF